MGCRAKKSRGEMVRIAALKSGEVKVNVKEGRGAYICKDEKCLKVAVKKGSIARALRCQINDEIYTKLELLIRE